MIEKKLANNFAALQILTACQTTELKKHANAARVLIRDVIRNCSNWENLNNKYLHYDARQFKLRSGCIESIISEKCNAGTNVIFLPLVKLVDI